MCLYCGLCFALLEKLRWLVNLSHNIIILTHCTSYDRESLVAETQWSSAQEKEMERLYSEFKSLKVGRTVGEEGITWLL